jgi:hypothetical protein
MKKINTLILFLLAITVHANEKTLQQLCSVNVQWQKQSDITSILAETNIAENINHIDLISLHLQLVEKTLKSRSVAHLNAQQQANRKLLLNKLNGYWNKKQFPINDYLSYKSPVFIDRFGTHCAVGYLMQESGFESLAREVDSKQKFAFVDQIKVEGIAEWANTNGFTIDELAWIQPGYWVTTTANDLGGGVNGQVNAIVVEQSGAAIYVAGEFNAAGGTIAANNIAVYQSGFAGWSWMALNNGVNGKIKTMIVHNNQLIVGGAFTQANGTTANHIATYDLINGQWQNMGSLDGTVNTLAIYNNEIYAGGSFTGMLAKWNGSNWQDANQMGFYGIEVRTLEVINNELIIGGDFELPTGALRKHVVGYDGIQFFPMGFGTVTPVNDLAFYNGRIYAGCDVVSGNDTCALALFNAANNDWEKVIMPVNNLGNSFNGTKICALAVNGTEMLCGGNFMAGAGLFFGNNMMRFIQTNTAQANDYILSPILNLDSTVNTIAMNNSLAYFGGDFVANNMSSILNHVAYFDVLTGIKEQSKIEENELIIFPNPANDNCILNFSTGFMDKDYLVISNSLGQEINRINLPKGDVQYPIEIVGLASGIYHINVYRVDKIYHQKLIVKK